jgi:hypothetical protein
MRNLCVSCAYAFKDVHDRATQVASTVYASAAGSAQPRRVRFEAMVIAWG